MNRLLTILGVFFLAACATPLEKSLSELSLGMEKSEVLEKAGSPRTSQRNKSKDIWTYSFFRGDKEFRQKLIFENGRVIELLPVRPYPDPQEAMQNANSLDEYEKVGQEMKKSKDSGFKDIDEKVDEK